MSRRSPLFQGVLTWGNPYSAILALRHLLVILMVAVALVRSLAFGRVTAPPVGQPGAAANGPVHTAGSAKPALASARDRVSVRLLLVNIVLGIGVLLLSAMASALVAEGRRLPL